MSSVFFTIGIAALLSFLGMIIARYLKQSNIMVFLLLGMILGPHGLDLLEQEVLEPFASIGLLLLVFFIGLNFSIWKLKESGWRAFLIAFFDILINSFVAFIVATFAGWSLVETLFLAGIVSMNSMGVAIPILEELNLAKDKDSQILVGTMVFSDLLSILMLTGIASISSNINTLTETWWVLLKLILIYLAAIIIAISVILLTPVQRALAKIKDENMIVLFVVGLSAIAGVLSESLGFAAILGAFLAGMVLSEASPYKKWDYYKKTVGLPERINESADVVKGFFITIFFINFGTRIDPSGVGEVFGFVLIIVPFVLFNEVFLTTAFAYLLGFSGKAAFRLGTALPGRGEDCVLYAEVATKMKVSGSDGVSSGTTGMNSAPSGQLVPFTGIFCLIMNILTPLLVRASPYLTNNVPKLLPEYVRYSGSLVSRTMNHVHKEGKGFSFEGIMAGLGLLLYFILCITVVFSQDYLVDIFSLLIVVLLLVFLFFSLRTIFRFNLQKRHFSELMLSPGQLQIVFSFVAGLLSIFMLALFIVLLL
ncbi:MAG: cation:proton antiporter, partial [Thermoplasmata archaeon]